MVTWILESNIFDKAYHLEMIKFLKDNAIPYHILTITSGEIEGKVPVIVGPVVFYGSLDGQKIVNKYEWFPGVWNNPELFNETRLIQAIGNQALNYDAKNVLFKDVLRETQWDPFFIKPNSDTKDFAGMIAIKDEFEPWYMRMKTIGYLPEHVEDHNVIISSPKMIGKEWRLVVLEQEIIAYSVYRQYQKILPKKECPAEVLDYAKYILSLYNPAPVFVLDICETLNGLRVIEANGFNSAGLYRCDIPSIISEITAFVEKTY